MNKKDYIKNKKVKASLEGVVVSSSMEKTIVVKVQRRFRHPFFGKTISCSKKYKVHDESGSAQNGDMVEIIECRPISKTKHMRIYRITKREN